MFIRMMSQLRSTGKVLFHWVIVVRVTGGGALCGHHSFGWVHKLIVEGGWTMPDGSIGHGPGTIIRLTSYFMDP